MSKKIHDEIFDFLNITDIKNEKKIISKLQSKKGPTKTSNWLTDNILIGRMPENCKELTKIIDSGITMFISLREYKEEYQKCITEVNKKYKNSIIFFRFDIPDFGTRDSDSIKALIDSIINYITIDKKKVMIHCLGGHGRTGTIAVPLIAILLFYENVLNKNNKKTFNEWNNTIQEYAELLFLRAQAYVMISLRSDRSSNSRMKKDIKSLRVPETHAQDVIVIEVIKKYIIDHLN